MPFCSSCGNSVNATDQFCAKCGARQPASGVPGISNRTASLLCYIPMVGWIAAVLVLASGRFRGEHQVRFHAFQGLYLFVAWLLVQWVVSPALYVSDYALGDPFRHVLSAGLQLLAFGAWIFMIVKVSHDENYKLPILGELAERSVSEQR